MPSTLPFRFKYLQSTFILTLGVSFVSASVAQSAPKSAASASASAQQAIRLAAAGRCTEALPILKHGLQRVTEKDLRYRSAMAAVRCAMGNNDDQDAADFLLLLKREFPNDPEVLYIATHYFSEMGIRAAQELAAKAPTSIQARRLQAEALESAGKNDEAAAIYHQILLERPQTPGIHYRLGQILLAKAGATGSTGDAKVEFEKELQVDPTNAASEFILGEFARRAGQWDEAIPHFTRAASLDVGFAEAYLALGMTCNASGKFADAVKPLEHYVALEPADPAGHYQLAMAYARTGNKQGSAAQLALQAKAASAAQATDTTEGHAAPQ